MLNIRHSLFETNSSSTHSLGIQKSNDDLLIPEVLKLVPGEYGWECDVLHSAEELGSYLYTAILYLYDDDPKTLSEWKTYIYDTCYDAGCVLEFCEPAVSPYGWTTYHVDHVDELADFLTKLRHSKKRLLRFLFGPKSFIITSNDNDGHEFLAEMENNLIDKNIEVYFKGN